MTGRVGFDRGERQRFTLHVLQLQRNSRLTRVWSFLSKQYKLCGMLPQYAPAPCDLDLWPFDLESGVRVTCGATSVPISFFLGLSVLDLGPMYAKTDVRQTDVRQHHRLMPQPSGRGIIKRPHLRIWLKKKSYK